MKQYLLFALAFFFLVSQSNAQEYFGRINGPASSEIRTMVVNKSDVLFLGTWGNGVRRSGNDGVSWLDANTGLTNLYINAIAFGTIGAKNYTYAATNGGGIFVSENDGNSWTDISAGLPTGSIKAIVTNSKGHIYVGTLGFGVYKSTDNGTNWIECNNGINFRDINALFCYRPDDIIIAASNGNGIYRTLDEGQTWSRSNASTAGRISLYTNSFYEEINTRNPVAANNGEGFFISGTKGLSWTPYDTTNIRELDVNCVSQLSDGTYLVGLRFKGMMVWDDLEYEWASIGPNNTGVTAIVRNSKGVVFVAYPNDGVYKINNRRLLDQVSLHNTPTTHKLASQSNGVFWSSLNTNGVYRSSDYGRTWTLKGLDSRQIIKIQANASRIVVQDASRVYTSTNDGDTWQEIIGFTNDTVVTAMHLASSGDIYYCKFWIQNPPPNPPTQPVIDIKLIRYNLATGIHSVEPYNLIIGLSEFNEGDNGDIYAFESARNLLRRSGGTWSVVNQNTFTAKPVLTSKFKNGKLFVGCNDGLYVSSDRGATFQYDNLKVPRKFGDGNIRPPVTGIAPRSGQEYYCNTNMGYGAHGTTNAGTDWTNLNRGMITGFGSDATISTDGDIIIAGNTLYLQMDPKNLLPPALVAPVNNKMAESIKPEFQWQTSTKADMYQFQVSDSDQFGGIFDEFVAATTSHTFSRTLDYNKKYYWRVRSKRFESYGDWAVRSFTTQLETPTAITPANDSLHVGLLPEFEWSEVDGASSYEIRLSKNADMSSPLPLLTSNTFTYKATTPLEYLNKYYWQVRAKNENNSSDWSDINNFTTKLPPPQLRYPENEASNLPASITFLWKKSETANSHFIQISRFDDFAVSDFDGQADTDSSHFFDFLEYRTKYYWRVYGRNNNGDSEFSDTWSFETGLEGVTLISPENNTVKLANTVQLLWNPADDVINYEIEVAENTQFTQNLKQFESNITDFELNDLAEFTEYFWRVRSVNGDTKGTWSATWKFRTAMSPATLSSPGNGSEGQRVVLLLRWEPVKGAQRYKFSIALDQSFNDIISSDEVTITSTNVDLAYGTTYYWKVQGIRDDEDGKESEVWSFTTEPNTSVHFDKDGELIKLSPNPADKFVNLDFGDLVFEKAILMSSSGEYLFEISKDKLNNNTLKLDLQTYATGTYYIILEGGGISKITPLKIVR